MFGFRLITSTIAKGTPNGVPFAMATLPTGGLRRKERESSLGYPHSDKRKHSRYAG